MIGCLLSSRKIFSRDFSCFSHLPRNSLIKHENAFKLTLIAVYILCLFDFNWYKVMIQKQSVLIEYISPNDEIYTSSGLLLSNTYVLITSNVLIPYLKSLTSNLSRYVKQFQPGILYFDAISGNIRPHIKVVSRSTLTQSRLQSKNATVIACFVCENIFKSCRKHLDDWAIDFQNKSYTAKEFLSLFFILKIGESKFNEENNHLITLFSDFLNEIKGLQCLAVGSELYTVSAPFGYRAFLGSYSQGIVSNVVGENDCFILTDCPTTPGSEGSPVFLKMNSNVMGVVLSCLNWWKGEWIGLTLVANLVPLLSQLVRIKPLQTKPPLYSVIERNENNVNNGLLESANKSLVQIISSRNWGTGICLAEEKGLFLTNSHVIESHVDTVIIHWRSIEIQGNVIYKTPNAEPYDLALIQCDPLHLKATDIVQIKISLEHVKIGEEVFAGGFPLFHKNLKPTVTLTKGHISQVNNCMIKTTCCVLPGHSGGAILRPNGHLVAIIVSNTKLDDVGVSYPRVNMAVPISVVHFIIKRFLDTGDILHLESLHCKDRSVCNQWSCFSSKL